MLTLGSLFSGIGGFEYAASLNGIETLWASEIEAAPISVTKKHFPRMKHLGDITNVNGAEIEPVDIISFGSPCQDLSIAGKRAGLEGKRSGLFMEALRIVKEMRKKTNGKYPTRLIWENVPGAFSSNNGEDFRTVLQEIAEIGENAGGGRSCFSIPKPKKWLASGTVVGNGWSLAWRILDAQYWGVPQRRKRIFLVTNLGGECAAEILFKRESLQGDIAEGGEAEKRIAGDVEDSVRTAGFNGWRSVTGSLEYEEERAPCLQASMPPNVVGVDGHNQNLTGNIVNTLRGSRVDKDNIGLVVYPEKVGSLISRADGSPCVDRGQPFIYDARGNGNGKIANAITGDHNGHVSDYTALAVHQNQVGEVRTGKVANTLSTNGNATGRNAPLVYAMAAKQQAQSIIEDQSPPNAVATFSFKSFGQYEESDKGKALLRCDDVTTDDLAVKNYSVRRLTPLECERLQGFPDGWTEYGDDGKAISDSARYKALGNSVAIPCVEFVSGRIREPPVKT